MFVRHRSSGREVYSWLLSAVVMYGEMVMIQSDCACCWCWLQSIRASISLRHVCFCRRSDDRRRSDTHPLSHHHHHHCCSKYNSHTHSRHTNTGWGTVHTWLHRYALHSVWTDLNPLNRPASADTSSVFFSTFIGVICLLPSFLTKQSRLWYSHICAEKGR